MQCFLQDRIEYRFKIARRGVDDLQHFGGGGLLLQRLARFGQQPRILHRDHRLRGKALQQRDLLVREWPNFLTVNRDRANKASFLAQRHARDSTSMPKFDYSPCAESR